MGCKLLFPPSFIFPKLTEALYIGAAIRSRLSSCAKLPRNKPKSLPAKSTARRHRRPSTFRPIPSVTQGPLNTHKLTTPQQLQMLKEQMSHSQGEHLEWIVIVLIAAEILVAVVNVVVDLFAGAD